jgi:tetratricopeptide (TPR) repeat protein
VRGEAGIGKTRLVEEFQRRAAAVGFTSHTGLVLDFGAGTGRDVIRVFVRSLLSIGIDSDPAALEAAAGRALAAGLIGAEQQVYLNDLLDLPQPTELRGLYDAMDNPTRNRGKRATVAALVQAESRRQPTVLVVEDLHWADRLTLDHLTTLVETVTTGPVILIMTTRLEGDPLDGAWRSGLGGGSLLTIDLGPLRPQEAASLAEAYFEANSEWARRCVERAAGNPLFLEQLLRHAEGSSEAGVPGSVQSLVQARMDRLEPADKQALQAASILGQQFSLDALRHLVESPGYACTGLIAHFLVRPQAKGFLFAHALIREGVYESLLQARRRGLHRRAAQWYAGQDAVLRAEHLERAEEPEAASAFGEAAVAEAKALRYERALALAKRGLALARTTDERLGLTMHRAEHLRELGRAKDSMAEFRDALGLTADEMTRCRAWIGVAAGVRLLGGDAEGLQALARRHQADRELARIGYYRGCLLFAAGEVDACVRQHEQARAAAVRAGDPEWEASTLSGLGDAHYARGRMRLALEHFRRCRTLCHQHGLGRAEVGSTHMIGVTRRYLNEFREAIDDLRAAASMAAKVGNTRTELTALFILGELLTDHGELEGAYAHLDRALAAADALGNRRFRLYVLYELGRALWYDERRRGEAGRVLTEALDLSREVGMTFLGPRVLAATALVTDSDPARRETLDEGEAIVRAGCLAHVGLWFYRDAIEASLIAADWAGAERYADALEEFTRPEPLPWSEFLITRGRLLAAVGRGRRDKETRQGLERCRDQARGLELLTPLPAMEQALAGFELSGQTGRR